MCMHERIKGGGNVSSEAVAGECKNGLHETLWMNSCMQATQLHYSCYLFPVLFIYRCIWRGRSKGGSFTL